MMTEATTTMMTEATTTMMTEATTTQAANTRPTLAPTGDFTEYAGMKCTKKRKKPFVGAVSNWYTAVGATKDEKKADCLAKCLSYPECETVSASKNFKNCFLGGWGDAETHEESSTYFCFERIMVDHWDYKMHTDTQCLRGPDTVIRVIAGQNAGFLDSEMRGCKVHCSNDPECHGISYRGNKCYFQIGGTTSKTATRGLNFKTKAKSKCYEKTLNALSTAEICWQANSLGLCDKAYGHQGPALSECVKDLDDMGNTELGTKFCAMLSKMMTKAGKKWKEGPVAQLENSSLAKICGASCPGTTWTMHEGKKCMNKKIRNDGKENLSICLAKCAAEEACMGVSRRGKMCVYQSRINVNDIKDSTMTGKDKDFCFVKN